MMTVLTMAKSKEATIDRSRREVAVNSEVRKKIFEFRKDVKLIDWNCSCLEA